MESIKATLWIYRTALRRSLRLIAANPGIVFAPLAYSVLLFAGGVALAPVRLIGGLLLTALVAACVSSGLYLLDNMLRMGKADLKDFVRGFSVYLGDVLTIAFILWVPMLLLSRVAQTTPQGPFILAAAQFLLYVFLNPVPELIYQGRASGLALLAASYQFIVANWVEWFVPNVALTAAGYLVLRALAAAASGLPFLLDSLLVWLASGVFLAFLMLFRGVLFADLRDTTRRGRLFRYRSRAE
ncbi:MAG TPA: hypothetical protein VNO43_15245 [Candidatus Eisenbacteria bacterium]|nr:hypothetical protein [Candidatus Eisenbacteria bacterium]